MKLHANASTCPNSRRLLVRRIEDEGWERSDREEVARQALDVHVQEGAGPRPLIAAEALALATGAPGESVAVEHLPDRRAGPAAQSGQPARAEARLSSCPEDRLLTPQSVTWQAAYNDGTDQVATAWVSDQDEGGSCVFIAQGTTTLG
jgi:hypothetical protein